MPTVGGIVVATGGAAEGRREFREIIDELARPINAADSTVRALAADGFRAAVRKLNRMGNWPWEHLSEDVNITANKALSSVSGKIKQPVAMYILDQAAGSRRKPISYQAYDVFLENYTMDLTGEPYVYTIPNLFETGQIRWFPTPSAAYNARLSYYRVTPAPRNETETVEIPEYATEAYMAIAWFEFMKRLPSTQRPFPITVAMSEAKDAFRTISSHVATPGDRTRQLTTG